MTDRRVYLDHAATTHLSPAAAQAWASAAAQVGNPSSLHTSGRQARRLVEESRESVADDLGVRPSEVVFTSGGTEADNLAVKGFAWRGGSAGRVLASPIEHHAVLDAVLWLEEQGHKVDWIPVDALGRVDVNYVRAHLDDDVAVCTVMWANNEIGTVQPIHQIAQACLDAGVPFHSDAVQALGAIPLDCAIPGLTSAALSGHKIGAPVGVGALILERDAEPVPLQHGGGQEREVRSGTVDAASIAAFAVAVHEAVEHQAEAAEHMRLLRDRLIDGIVDLAPEAVVNGDRVDRLPGNVHVTFPGCEGDALLMLLDAAGVECSTGSACTSGIPEPSHVLLAMGVDARTARGSLRLSLSRTSTDADIDRVLDVLPAALGRAARASSPRLRSRV